MKKILFSLLLMCSFFCVKAQYATINAILTKLEEKRGFNQDLRNENLDDKKFVAIKDFEDHTERNFIIIKGKNATYVEMFDDKETGKSTSNVFSGDLVKTRNNLISFRFDKLEGKKIPMPITKTMILTKQKKILYLVDVNTKERWIDEISF